MLRHIVMLKFRDFAEGAQKEQNLRRAKELLESLPAKIDLIRKFEVGVDITHTDQSYDLVLYSEFDDSDALVTYQRHPEHVKVMEFLRKVQTGKGVIDYQI